MQLKNMQKGVNIMPFDESKSILYQIQDCFDEICSSELQITVMLQS